MVSKASARTKLSGKNKDRSRTKPYIPITPEMAERLNFILEHCAFATVYELDVVVDRLDAITRLGLRAVITPKQIKVVEAAYRKTKQGILDAT